MPQDNISLIATRELLEAWPVLSNDDRLEGFRMLSRGDAEELFLTLSSRDQADLLALYRRLFTATRALEARDRRRPRDADLEDGDA